MDSIEKSTLGVDQDSAKKNKQEAIGPAPEVPPLQNLNTTKSDPDKPKRKIPLPKILVAGIIILVTLLAFGLIAYLVMGQNKSTPTVITEVEELSPASNAAVKNPTTDWKTYINEDYGFSLKYPPSWDPEKCSTGAILCSENITELTNQTESIYYFIFSNDAPPVENMSEIGEISYTEDIINGINVLRTTDLPSRSGAETIFFKKSGNKYIQLGFTPYDIENPLPKQQQNYEIFKQILSTFKFMDASDTSNMDTSGWKTYENSKYGFTVKYPSNWITTKLYRPESSSYTHLNLGFAPSQKVDTGYEYIFTIEHYDNPNNLSFQDWDTKENESKQMTRFLYSSDTKTENYAGYNAYVNEKGNCEPVFCKEVIIMQDKNILVFRNIDRTNLDYTKEEIESYKPLFNQILSTLKFTE